MRTGDVEEDGTALRSCHMVRFVISGAEPSGCNSIVTESGKQAVRYLQ